MIENRELTKEEFDYLVENTSDMDVINDTEKRFDYFKDNAVEQFGILINGLPIYWAGLVKNKDRHELWTIPNKDIKQQFSLYKICKKTWLNWADKYEKIYAYVRKSNNTILNWAIRMGAEVINDDNLITLCLIGG